MKITCPSCSARYSIDDAKVKGKAFKFTCKKCGQTHVYRGTGDGTAAAVAGGGSAAPATGAASPAAGGGYEEEAVWYVAVGEEQQGPYTTQQIREYAQADQLDPESYLWKEGMEDWLPVQQIPEFADLTLGGGEPAPAAAAAPPADSPFGGMPDDVTVASPFAAAAPPPGDAGDLFSFGAGPRAAAKPESSPFDAFGAGGGSAAVASRGGADVFAAAQQSPFDQTEDREQDVMMGAAAAAPSPRVDASRMIGQRNENSVLFSLSSLQALAGGRSGGGGAAAAAPKAGFASGEGSGLIDIRAMAGSAAKREEKPDDLFALGGGGAIGAPVAVPILTRPIRHDDDSRKPMYILIGVIGAFAIAIVVLLIFLLKGGDKEKEVIVKEVPAVAGADGGTIVAATTGGPEADAGAKEEPDAAAAKADEDKGAGGDAGEAGGDGDPNAKAADGGDGTGGEDDERPGSSGSGRRRDAGRNPSSGGSSGTGPVPAAAASSGRDAGSSGQTRDAGRLAGDLSAIGLAPTTRRDAGSGSSSSGSSGASGSLPATPDRDAVKAKFESVRGAVRACTGGQAGTAQAQTTIQGSTGRVTRVNVTGDFTGPAATCITNAIRGLTFPQFGNPTLTVNYSYRF
ncbi:MAG: DUF4339 domain-containing protein [Myxococcales bacterium]|nr:DUF4339 domain-containing protein [Myxococcales bacterium]